MAIASPLHAIHLRLKKNFTPPLYLKRIRLKDVSKALWKREEKLSFCPLDVSIWGVISKVHKAGLNVNAFTAEIPTATAMVSPNCV